jgi:hypothetical protein
MTGKAQLSIFCNEDKLIFGSMGSMARETPLLALNGAMGNFYLCRFFVMASRTELISLLSKKGLVLRGMGAMAGKAHSFLKWVMLNIAAGLQVRGVMALIAEFPPTLGGVKGILRTRRVMAILAADFRYRVMGGCFQEFGL